VTTLFLLSDASLTPNVAKVNFCISTFFDVKTDGFTQVANGFLRDPTVSPAAKLVGALMASHVDSCGIAWPGTKLLMSEGNLRRDAVLKGRAEIVKKGFVKKFSPKAAAASFSAFATK
jgi:hypothetical protein